MRDILGAAFAAILLAWGMATWLPRMQSAQAVPSQNVAATHIVQVAVAANDYIPAYFATLLAQAASGPFVITVPQLQAAPRYSLNPTFVDQTPYQHSHVVLVYAPTPTTLKALVVGIGGQTIPEPTLNRLAALADLSNNAGTGGLGGAIHVTNSLTNSSYAIGAIGDWTELLSNYAAGGYSPAPGHLAVLLDFSETSAISPYLSRYPVAGHPEAGQMSQPIDMQGNAINNASDVYLSSTKTYLSNAPMFIDDVPPGTVITKPSCPANQPTPHIYVTPGSYQDNAVGDQISGVNTWAIDNAPASTWTVNLTIQTAAGTVPPSSTNGYVQVMTACGP